MIIIIIITNGSSNLSQMTRPCNSRTKEKKNKTKENLPNSGLCRSG